MREIKFRAWDGEQMHHDWMIFSEEAGEVTARQLAKKASVVMQFTGLRDKNGREIYEGDIVCFVDDVVVETIGGFDRTEPEGKFREVAWNQLHCGWGLFENGGQSEDMLADWINEDGSVPRQWECKELEVIGNKWENPDLLSPGSSAD